VGSMSGRVKPKTICCFSTKHATDELFEHCSLMKKKDCPLKSVVTVQIPKNKRKSSAFLNITNCPKNGVTSEMY